MEIPCGNLEFSAFPCGNLEFSVFLYVDKHFFNQPGEW